MTPEEVAQMEGAMENFCKQIYQTNKQRMDEAFKELTTPKEDEDE